MPPDRDVHPDDPREWLRVAREDLALAKSSVPGVGYGLLCFHAQQAAEKATKAVLIARSICFPYVHDIGLLLHLARTGGVNVPVGVAEADLLTDYPHWAATPVIGSQSRLIMTTRLTSASAVIQWAERTIGA